MDFYCCWKHWKRLHFYALIFFLLLCLIVIRGIPTINTNPKSNYEINCWLSSEADNHLQETAGKRVNGGARRVLGGLGSSPPRCASKCGGCTPCRAVHVPVPPGTPVTMEYYPEAWRCKCGNKLYIP